MTVKLREKYADATRGPWKYRDDPLDTGRILVSPDSDDLLMGHDDYQDEANATLICEMHAALPALLDAFDCIHDLVSALDMEGLGECEAVVKALRAVAKLGRNNP